MKKGLVGAFLGVFIFLGVFTFIFNDLTTFRLMFAIGPFIFIIFVATIFSRIVKKVADSDDRHRHHEEQNLLSRTESVRCKQCSALISKDDRYCPACGASQKDTIICEYCGHENPATNALCEKCNGFL